MARYRYAYDDLNTLLDVVDLPSDRVEVIGSFRCIGCSQQLIAKTKGERCVCQGKTRPFDTLKVGHVITRPSAACHVKSDRRLSTVSRVVPVPRGLPAVS